MSASPFCTHANYFSFRALDGFVRKMKVGGLRYTAVYKANGSVRRVKDNNGRRALVGPDDIDEADMIPTARRLAALTCDDCETVWSLICNGGMDTLCGEIEYGKAPLVDQPQVEASFSTQWWVVGDRAFETVNMLVLGKRSPAWTPTKTQ